MKTSIKRSAGWLSSEAIDRLAIHKAKRVSWKVKGRTVEQTLEPTELARRQHELMLTAEDIGASVSLVSWIYRDWTPQASQPSVKTITQAPSGVRFTFQALDELAAGQRSEHQGRSRASVPERSPSITDR